MPLQPSTNEVENRICKPKHKKKQYLKLRPPKHGQDKVWFTLEAEMRKYSVSHRCNARQHGRPGTVTCTQGLTLAVSDWAYPSGTPQAFSCWKLPGWVTFHFSRRQEKGEEQMLEVFTQYLRNLNLVKIFNWNPNESTAAGFNPTILTKASPLQGLIRCPLNWKKNCAATPVNKAFDFRFISKRQMFYIRTAINNTEHLQTRLHVISGAKNSFPEVRCDNQKGELPLKSCCQDTMLPWAIEAEVRPALTWPI